jgi:DNA-binding NarL/FixJ family response regulator
MHDLMKSNKARPRVLLADDHSIMAERLRSLLEDSCEVVGIVQNGRQLLDLAPKLMPDVVVLDVGMPLINGLDAAKQLRQSSPSIKLVFLTMADDAALATAALELGAIGYVLKHAASSELLRAISEVLQGRPYVTPRLRSANWAARKVG